MGLFGEMMGKERTHTRYPIREGGIDDTRGDGIEGLVSITNFDLMARFFPIIIIIFFSQLLHYFD